MSGISGLSIALQALLSQQHAIQVTEHNVANANTVGYHRQQSIFVAGPSVSLSGITTGLGPGQMGSGVVIQKIQRFSTDFYDTRYRREVGQQSQWEVQRDVLTELESMLGETGDNSLIKKMDAFWKGWSTLADDPSNLSLRNNVLDLGTSLASAVSNRAMTMVKLRQDQNTTLVQRTDEVNTLAKQVGVLNKEIANIYAVGEQPNDLLDQRDQILDRLSKLTGASMNLQSNGEMSVSINGHVLVMGTQVQELKTDMVDGLVEISWVNDPSTTADDKPFEPPTGEIRGIMNVRDDITERFDGLNALATQIAAVVNDVHNNGYGLNDATHRDFFSISANPDEAALSLSVALTDAKDVAVATTLDPITGGGSAGDGTNATALSELRNFSVAGLGAHTLNDYYNNEISTLGLTIKLNKQNASANASSADAIATQRESIAGVNLDEEAINMVKYQRLYQAASRMITALDEMLDKIINGTGLVGR